MLDEVIAGITHGSGGAGLAAALSRGWVHMRTAFQKSA
jgi:hypothetical protein